MTVRNNVERCGDTNEEKGKSERTRARVELRFEKVSEVLSLTFRYSVHARKLRTAVPLFHHHAALSASDFYARRFAFRSAILCIPLTENNILFCFPGAFRRFVGTKETATCF
jgi:hypothetical protein